MKTNVEVTNLFNSIFDTAFSLNVSINIQVFLLEGTSLQEGTSIKLHIKFSSKVNNMFLPLFII
jgi:hypothetical protein